MTVRPCGTGYCRTAPPQVCSGPGPCRWCYTCRLLLGDLDNNADLRHCGACMFNPSRHNPYSVRSRRPTAGLAHRVCCLQHYLLTPLLCKVREGDSDAVPSAQFLSLGCPWHATSTPFQHQGLPGSVHLRDVPLVCSLHAGDRGRLPWVRVGRHDTNQGNLP